MRVLLYRPSFDLASGAGQLMQSQFTALRAAGVSAEIGCARGALKFWLRGGRGVRRLSAASARRLQQSDERFVVDHGLCVPRAELIFVHNLATEANLHVPRADWLPQIATERAFFRELQPAATVVANSELVKSALCRHFDVAPERVVVHYPGYRSDRFTPEAAAALRGRARRSLGLEDGTPLVGFVTSGDFQKRGLDLFLECAKTVAAVFPDARFLAVGSSSLPEYARSHALVRAGRVLHRPKCRRPQRWFAALDLFLYAARFEEFGMVVSEARASGVPIVTSRVVGATECLPPVYERWLAPRPTVDELAGRALALLADDAARRELARAGAAGASVCDHRAYARATITTIATAQAAAQKRRLR
jgi:glycosyltransferase involved in cell wall biosynthesis